MILLGILFGVMIGWGIKTDNYDLYRALLKATRKTVPQLNRQIAALECRENLSAKEEHQLVTLLNERDDVLEGLSKYE